MTRYLLPIAVLSIVLLCGQPASAHHHMHHNFGNAGMAAGFRLGNGWGYGGWGMNRFGGYNGFGLGTGYGPVFYGGYPGFMPMIYPGMGYVSNALPGVPGNVYTQSYFNSPAYGHWGGFGK